LIQNRENLGFAAANNQAMRQSRGRYVLLLNSDTEVYPGSLQTLVRFMDENAQAGACGPQLLNLDGSRQISCHRMLTPWREFWLLTFLERLVPQATYAQENWDHETPHAVEVLKGACILLRQQALEQVGRFDEQYFFYTEEMDLCKRLSLAGWTIWWIPKAKVKHYGEASSKQMAEPMYVQLYRSKVQFHRKFGGPHQATRFKLILRLMLWPRLAIATLGSCLSPSLAGRAHAYRRLLTELPTM
jgi:GT2 family glycosyltransferase